MIPFIIHYCWFGKSEKPKLIEECIISWRSVMPNAQIKLWDESNVPIEKYRYMQEAYDCKKYAFVSDYARYLILQKEGGIFLDCDVKALKTLEPLLGGRAFFTGFAKAVKRDVYHVSPGLLLASEPNHPILQKVLTCYDELSIYTKKGEFDISKTSPIVLTELLVKEYGLQTNNENQVLSDNIEIFSSEYFSPLDPLYTSKKKYELTDNSYLLHLGAASWVPSHIRIKTYLSILFHRLMYGLCSER